MFLPLSTEIRDVATGVHTGHEVFNGWSFVVIAGVDGKVSETSGWVERVVMAMNACGNVSVCVHLTSEMYLPGAPSLVWL